MKKYIVSLFIFGFVFGGFFLSNTVNAQQASTKPQGFVGVCLNFQNNMGYGMSDTGKNHDIEDLQNFLLVKGYLSGYGTGYFGILTVSSVKALQGEYGLSQTGYVGLLTRARIKKETCTNTVTTNSVNVTSPSVKIVPANPNITAKTTTVIYAPCTNGVLYSTATGQLCPKTPGVSTTTVPTVTSANSQNSTTASNSNTAVNTPLSSITSANPYTPTNPAPLVSVCNQTHIGSEAFTLDANTPADRTIPYGLADVELARVVIANTGTEDICYINGIQIGSNDDVNGFISNVRVIDLSTNTQVGQSVNTFNNNGTYNYEWVSGYSLPVSVNTSKTFKILGDIKKPSTLGKFRFGIFGVNHSGFGASPSGLPLIANYINVVAPIINHI